MTLGHRLDALEAEGFAMWDRFDREVRDRGFHPFVAADYTVVRGALAEHLVPGRRFLEWGSATGVITIMADLMGYDASGIELDGSLVSTARDLAVRHASGARFVAGSFLPAGYDWKAGRTGTIGSGESGYFLLGRALDDFDVVFGFPWDGEGDMMRDLMQRYGSPEAVLLLFGVNSGITAYRGGRSLIPPAAPRPPAPPA